MIHLYKKKKIFENKLYLPEKEVKEINLEQDVDKVEYFAHSELNNFNKQYLYFNNFYLASTGGSIGGGLIGSKLPVKISKE